MRAFALGERQMHDAYTTRPVLPTPSVEIASSRARGQGQPGRASGLVVITRKPCARASLRRPAVRLRAGAALPEEAVIVVHHALPLCAVALHDAWHEWQAQRLHRMHAMRPARVPRRVAADYVRRQRALPAGRAGAAQPRGGLLREAWKWRFRVVTTKPLVRPGCPWTRARLDAISTEGVGNTGLVNRRRAAWSRGRRSSAAGAPWPRGCADRRAPLERSDRCSQGGSGRQRSPPAGAQGRRTASAPHVSSAARACRSSTTAWSSTQRRARRRPATRW